MAVAGDVITQPFSKPEVVLFQDHGTARLASCQFQESDRFKSRWLNVRWPSDGLVAICLASALLLYLIQTMPEGFLVAAAYLFCPLWGIYLVIRWLAASPATKAVRLAQRSSEGIDIAITKLLKLLERQQPTSDVCNVLGVLLALRCEWWEADRILDRSAFLDRSDHVCLGNRAFVLWQLGEFDHAFQILDEAHRMQPTDFLAVWMQSQILLDVSRLEEARLLFHKVEALCGDWLRHGPFASTARALLVQELRQHLSQSEINPVG
jgi:tetratricopeptide (TPR) repeat protein